MNTPAVNFDTTKSLVDSLDALEKQLVTSFREVHTKSEELRKHFQTQVCDHRNTTKRIDFGSHQYQKTERRTTCDDCKRCWSQ
jgi:hypothetical protein